MILNVSGKNNHINNEKQDIQDTKRTHFFNTTNKYDQEIKYY